MKRIIITTALLIGTVLAAQAAPVTAYYDLVRPNGHKRSEAVFQADLNFCLAQTGQNRFSQNGPAFKKCMLSRGYRFMWERGWASGPAQGTGHVDDRTPPLDITSPPPAAPMPDLSGSPDTNPHWGE